MSEPFFAARAAEHARDSGPSSRTRPPPSVEAALPAPPLPDDRRRRTANDPRVRGPVPLGPVRDGHRPPEPRPHPRRRPRRVRLRVPRQRVRGRGRLHGRRSGNGTGLTVEAKSFSDSYYANGSPSDYASELVLYKDGHQVGAADDPGQPADALRRRHLLPVLLRPGRRDEGRGRDRQRSSFEQGVPLQWSSNDGTRARRPDPAPRCRADGLRPRAPPPARWTPRSRPARCRSRSTGRQTEGAAIAIADRDAGPARRDRRPRRSPSARAPVHRA